MIAVMTKPDDLKAKLAAALSGEKMSEQELNAIREAMSPDERLEWDKQQFEWAKQVLESFPEEWDALSEEIVKQHGGPKKWILDIYQDLKRSGDAEELAKLLAWIEGLQHSENLALRELAEQVLAALRNDS